MSWQRARQPANRPVQYRDILATVYHNLGIDPHQLVRDEAELPRQTLPDTAQPIRELLS
jgi:hypothetical protein